MPENQPIRISKEERERAKREGIEIKICLSPECQNEFLAKPSHKKVCSDNCRYIYNKKKKLKVKWQSKEQM